MSITVSPVKSRLLSVLNEIGSRYGTLAKSINETRYRRSKFRTALWELGSLSDRALADIGIHRSQIRRLALEESRKGQFDDNA